MSLKSKSYTDPMSYKLIRQFRKVRREKRLSSIASDLFLLLLDECAMARWQNPFEVRTLDILNETGMSRPTLIKAQKELSDAGLVEIKTSNSPKKGSLYTLQLVKNFYNSKASTCKEFLQVQPDLLVKNLYNSDPSTCKEFLQLTPTCKEFLQVQPDSGSENGEKQKEKIPHTPLKEKYIPTYSVRGSSAPAPAHTHEGEVFFSNVCLDVLFREEGERACAGVTEEYEELCHKVIRQWEAFGEDLTDGKEQRRKFRNWLAVEAENRRREKTSGKDRPQDERKKILIEEIKKARDEAGDSSGAYDRDTLNDFLNYWTQKTPDGQLFAFEAQEYWDTKTRLRQWIDHKNNRRR